jgi:acyl carrier protein phosphodiesterase
MEESLLLEESLVDMNSSINNLSADQTTMESISFDQSHDHVQSISNKKAPLGISKRRVKKNTAVVLNADRLKRFSLEESYSSLLDESVNATNSQPQRNELLDKSNKDMDSNHRLAGRKILQWYRRMKLRSNRNTLISTPVNNTHSPLPINNQLSDSFVPISVQEKLFALVLGYRVRKLMSIIEVKNLIKTQRDIKTVLLDLFHQHPASITLLQYAPNQPVDLLVERWQQQRLEQSVPCIQSLGDVDHSLASTLVRQILGEREKMLNIIYKHAKWIRRGHDGGYWQLEYLSRLRSTTNRRRTSGGTNSNTTTTPVRQRNKVVADTPPHLKQHIESTNVKVPVKLFVSKNNTKLLVEEQLEDGGSVNVNTNTNTTVTNTMPRSLKDVLDSKIPSSSKSITTSPLMQSVKVCFFYVLCLFCLFSLLINIYYICIICIRLWQIVRSVEGGITSPLLLIIIILVLVENHLSLW